jgi:hypothetical protein
MHLKELAVEFNKANEISSSPKDERTKFFLEYL